MANPNRLPIVLGFFFLAGGAPGASAQRVPESEQIPVDIRRTTLLVRDVDRSLAFWRDALGLKVIYDRVLGEPPHTTRLVLLRANDEFIGNLGIMRRSTDPKDRPLLIGSVKSNLGHLEAASGVAGLVKAVYCVQHRTVPATINVETPNPHIPLDDWNLRVARKTTALKASGRLIVGVNSFGFGGANAHVVLESPPASVEVAVDHSCRRCTI